MTAPQSHPSDNAGTGARYQKARSAVDGLRATLTEASRQAERTGEAFLTDLSEEVDRWLELLDDTGQRAADETELQLHLAVMEVGDRAHELKDVFDDALKRVSGAAQEGKEKLDTARVQAHLAKLDAADAALERGKRFRSLLAEASKAAHHPAKAAEQELVRLIETWGKLRR